MKYKYASHNVINRYFTQKELWAIWKALRKMPYQQQPWTDVLKRKVYRCLHQNEIKKLNLEKKYSNN